MSGSMDSDCIYVCECVCMCVILYIRTKAIKNVLNNKDFLINKLFLFNNNNNNINYTFAINKHKNYNILLYNSIFKMYTSVLICLLLLSIRGVSHSNNIAFCLILR